MMNDNSMVYLKRDVKTAFSTSFLNERRGAKVENLFLSTKFYIKKLEISVLKTGKYMK